MLGVSPSSTEDEIKTAYRALAKKYHPDNYADSPLSDLASEKMKEINEAYDEIMRQRKARQASGSSGPSASTYGWGQGSGYGAPYGGSSSNYIDVRNMIRSGRIADAEQILNGVPSTGRDAEWYFLKGTVLYRRGWMTMHIPTFRWPVSATHQTRNTVRRSIRLKRSAVGILADTIPKRPTEQADVTFAAA